ncbi:MAG TPA: OmpA family protein [Cytophagales bacterium]|nr:OmpA family protein [Cytophagales bacterium]
MKTVVHMTTSLLIACTLGISCKSMNRTQKGAAIGTVGGGVIGGVIGRASGNTALGAIIGATVGGVSGAIIGRKMDKQAEEISKSVPNAKVERVGEGIVVEFSEKILFGYDKADLNAGAKKNLNKLVTVLSKYPDTNIEVQGHTDSQGTDDYNLSLSKKRATNVSNYLSAKGIASSRLSTVGYGEGAPKYSNDTPADRAQNRRVEFLISANAKMRAEAESEANRK